ncbi:DinB family protein [Aestuariimicrobium soli]|uniref:DinB family protein n=1 Tax=Aestuariimicrobium soli TaxID=2035834 RepID=UPI003EB97891
MTYEQAEIDGAVEAVNDRLADRLSGLTDHEWAWQPIPGADEVTLRWRLDHIVDAVAGERNWAWLGAEAGSAPAIAPADSAATAVANVAAACAAFLALVRDEAIDLDAAIGPVGGPHSEEPRRALVLHTLDEFTHHAAEAALIRDLYAGRQPSRNE